MIRLPLLILISFCFSRVVASPDPRCKDTVGWTDFSGEGCWAYAADPAQCATDFGGYDAGKGSAQTQCCACGGGNSDGCQDTVDWSDSTDDGSNGCYEYGSNEGWCTEYGDNDYGNGPAKTHCCACGGGCEDTDGWSDGTDDGANGCYEYGSNGWCTDYGDNDYGYGPAKTHCCACGGGHEFKEVTTTTTTTTTTTPQVCSCDSRDCYKQCFEVQKKYNTHVYKRCFEKQKALTADAEAKCLSPNADDGSAAGVDQCFTNGGNCASCCGACTVTTDLDNRAKDSCVCYEASTAPSGGFYGTEKHDCVFIEADDVSGIQVRNQCLKGAEAVLAPPRRGS